MYDKVHSAKFKRDLRLAKKRSKDLDMIEAVIDVLAEGKPLPAECYDHSLKGEYRGYRECHIEPDWLLIYKIDNELLVLVLFRTGTHADLFGKST